MVGQGTKAYGLRSCRAAQAFAVAPQRFTVLAPAFVARARYRGRSLTVALVAAITALQDKKGLDGRPVGVASAAPGPIVTVAYVGTYDGAAVEKLSPQESSTATSHVAWDLSWTGPLQALLSPGPKELTIETLTGGGTLSQLGKSCDTTFSPVPSDVRPGAKLFEPPLNAYRDPSDPSQLVVSVGAPIGIEALQSDDTSCDIAASVGASGNPMQVLTPDAQFAFAVSRPQTKDFSDSWKSNDAEGEYTSKVASTVSFFYQGQLAPGQGEKTPGPSTPLRVRALALKTWASAARLDRVLCSGYGLPVTFLSEALVFSSNIVGPFFRSSPFEVTLDMAEMCVKLGEIRLYSAKIYADPPVGNYRELASVGQDQTAPESPHPGSSLTARPNRVLSPG